MSLLTASNLAISFGPIDLFSGISLEVPHRALGGVFLGILRYKSGSLLPCVLAHFLNNLAAVSI